ncbi:MAG: hypothetical protein LBT27_04455, partial [Prevotellaceae bacterium]|nr:hypothetical protein [Prevotellaceae bacterium]
AFSQAFELSKKIMAKIIKHNAHRTDGDVYIDFAKGTTYLPRGPLASNVYGYEFIYVTKDEIELIDNG